MARQGGILTFAGVVLISITEIWKTCHLHLQPFVHHLSLPANQYQPCPQCHSPGAFHVLVNLDLPGAVPELPCEVLHCPACGQFFVAEKLEYGGTEYSLRGNIVKVDARLWNRQPSMLNIEPTTRCNLACWYCLGRHMPESDIDRSSFVKMLKNSPSVETVALVGEGEPVLHPDFFKMSQDARMHARKIVTVSNGTLLNQTNIRKMCEAGVLYISVSIDSADSQQFASSRVNGALSEVLEGIRRLRVFRDQNDYRYPKIGVKGTLFDYSQNQLIRIVEMAREHGAEIFESFQALNPKQSYCDIYPEEHLGQLETSGVVASRIVRDSRKAMKLLKPVQEFFEEESISFFDRGRENPIRRNCNETSLHLLTSGHVTSCCQVKEPICEGLDLTLMPLAEILSNSHYENLRFNLWNGIFPNACEGCSKTC